MLIIEPSVVVYPFGPVTALKNIERAGRVAYKSEEKMSDTSYVQFIEKIIKSGHDSVLEHEKLSVKFIVDRGISHELVRHRLASYTQESTRYCNYSQDKFGGEITVIKPFFFDKERHDMWKNSCEDSEAMYFGLLNNGATPQEARSVLPNSLKTEVMMTANMREWRHFFNLRCAREAHPQMRQVAIPLFLFLKNMLFPLFEDVGYDTDFDPNNYAEVFWYDYGMDNMAKVY